MMLGWSRALSFNAGSAVKKRGRSEKEEKMQHRYKSLFAVVLAVAAFSVGTVPRQSSAAQARCTLTIVNESNKDIHRLHLSLRGTGNWGPDLLGRNVLHPGDRTSLNISAGEYDLLAIDANGNQCVQKNIPVYNDRSWPIRGC